jgi:hypothetical protein
MSTSCFQSSISSILTLMSQCKPLMFSVMSLIMLVMVIWTWYILGCNVELEGYHHIFSLPFLSLLLSLSLVISVSRIVFCFFCLLIPPVASLVFRLRLTSTSVWIHLLPYRSSGPSLRSASLLTPAQHPSRRDVSPGRAPILSVPATNSSAFPPLPFSTRSMSRVACSISSPQLILRRTLAVGV